MNKFILSLLLCVSLNAFAAELHELLRSPKTKIDQVREYLDRYPEHVNHESTWKKTPLFEACNVEIARLLIDRGADVNHEDSLKETPLFKLGDVEIAQLLIDRGADVNHENKSKQTPLFWSYDVEVARLLIDRGADVNHECTWKQTPLFRAAYWGYVESVRLLIDRGADVNHEDKSKETPLLIAASQLIAASDEDDEKQYVEIVRLLIDRGADVNHENSSKQTPLFKAVKGRIVEVVQLLIDHGANVNQVDYHGITPLFEAATNFRLECVRLLLESGANIPFTVAQAEAVRSINYIEVIQLLEDKNILTASREVVADSSAIDGLMKKQLKPCVRQPNATTCMAHALKNAGLLTKYYKAEVEEREEIDKKFTSQRVYDECFQSDAFASLRAIITGQDFTTLAGGRAGEIGTAVFKISRTIDPKIQVVFDPKNFSLRQRDQSRKSEVVLVLSNKVHWHAIGLEEQPNGAVEISVLDSFFNHFCLEENFYRKLTLWFKGGSIEQPATEQLISRLYRKLILWFKGGNTEQPATQQLRSRL